MQIVDEKWIRKKKVINSYKGQKKKRRNLELQKIKQIKEDLILKRKLKFSKTDPFYSSLEWRMVRGQALCRSKLCEKCGSNYQIQVDHIKPRSRYPELELDISNLQVLCESCNMGKGAWDETDWRTSAT